MIGQIELELELELVIFIVNLLYGLNCVFAARIGSDYPNCQAKFGER